MKIQHFILSLFVISLSHFVLGHETHDEIPDEWEAHSKCMKELRIGYDEDPYELMEGNDPRAKCWDDCILKQMGYNSLGRLDIDKFIQDFEKIYELQAKIFYQVSKSLYKCKYPGLDTRKDSCANAAALRDCEYDLLEKAYDMYSLKMKKRR